MPTFKVDLHTHTCVLKNSVIRLAMVVDAAKKRGLARIFIVDTSYIACSVVPL